MALAKTFPKLARRNTSRIDAAVAEAYLCRDACASKSEMNREAKLWCPGGLVAQWQFDYKKIPQQKCLPKSEFDFGYTFRPKSRYKACAAPG